MKNFNLFFKKSFISSLCLTILLASFPVSVFAQSAVITPNDGSEIEINTTNSPTSIPDTSTSNGSFQNIQYTGGSTDSGFSSINNTSAGGIYSNNPGSSAGGAGQKQYDPSKGGIVPVQEQTQGSSEDQAISEAVSCSVGVVLGNALTSVISTGVDTLLEKTVGTFTNPKVPTDPKSSRKKEVASAEVFDIPILPSWDAIAYCLANVIITYVSDSTIAWIQSGFEGKPAFVDDPTKLFNDIADYEMSNFLETLGGGALCEPFEAYVTLGLVENYTNDFSTTGRCTLDTVEGNINSFLSGDSFNYDTWFAMTQNPANNPYGSYLLAESEARNRISAGIGPIKTELDWGNGYFAWKAKDGPNAGKTITPGTVIQSQLEERLNLAPNRLVLAEKFDQVISSLVNYLIKTALTETLGAVKGQSN
jgi:hypothetical protein